MNKPDYLEQWQWEKLFEILSKTNQQDVIVPFRHRSEWQRWIDIVLYDLLELTYNQMGLMRNHIELIFFCNDYIRMEQL